MDLRTALPSLLPRAIAWAETVAVDAAARGVPLDERGINDAMEVGVKHPDKVRVLMVDWLPRPEDPELQAAATQTGLLGPSMVGLTLGYSVFIRYGYLSRRLLSHECRHVFQFERAGSIEAFLPDYLGSIANVGYANCPYELDAKAHEIPDA